MTQKEKAEAYDKAFEIAENIHRFSSNIAEIKRMEDLFPELKESEDEKIRKELITHCRNTKCVTEEGAEIIAKWIAWLEKQSTDISSFPKEQQVFMRKYVSLDKIILIKLLAERDANNSEIIKSFEKQGEKPTIEMITPEESLGITSKEWNEIENECIFGEDKPKFKVGDWVVYNRNDHSREILQIYDIRDNRYYFNDNIHFSWSVKECDEKSRLWTIQDAKDGDVLAFNDGHGNDCIELIKSITGKKIEFWFCLTNGNYYEVFDGITPYTNLVSREDATPATKEQRDLLFNKMKEAGYEWDAEKKELKKIDKENLTEFEIAVKNVMEEAIEAGDTHNLKADAENLLRIIQPTWTGEDENRLKSCLNILQPKISTGKNIETINTKWLKSLKERLL